MRVTNLAEYVQVVDFIRRGEEILTRANAEAKELAGEDGLIQLEGLRQKIDHARKQKAAFEGVEDLRSRGIRRLSDFQSIFVDLRLMYELEDEPMPPRFWQLNAGALDEELSKHGIRLNASVDLSRFETMHPAQAADAATPRRARAQRTRSSSPHQA